VTPRCRRSVLPASSSQSRTRYLETKPEGVVPVNQSHASPALPRSGTAGVEASPRPEASHRPSRWTGGRIAAAVIGALLVLVSVVLLGGGGTGLWADLTQRHGGYVTTGSHAFSTSGSALATEPTHLGSPGVGWLYSPSLLGKVRIRVTPVSSGPALFIGIARTSDVDRYLAGVNHTVISDFFGNKVEVLGGGRLRSAPGTQHFWVASSSGPGTRTVTWSPHGGSWTVVAMNADTRPGIGVRADLGARMPAVLWIAVGLLAAGAVLLVGGGLLIAGAIRGRRNSQATVSATDSAVPVSDYQGRSDAEH
jgi:hypothetical protein